MIIPFLFKKTTFLSHSPINLLKLSLQSTVTSACTTSTITSLQYRQRRQCD